MKNMTRLGAVVGAYCAVVLILSGQAAMACTNLSTLLPAGASADAGATVMMKGHSFDTGSGLVTLHWASASGAVLAVAKPDSAGNFQVAVKIPQDAAWGSYVIVATQMDKTGAPAFGTPARTAFQVGPTVAPAPATAALGGALLVALGPLGLLMFALGLAFFLREYRRLQPVGI